MEKYGLDPMEFGVVEAHLDKLVVVDRNDKNCLHIILLDHHGKVTNKATDNPLMAIK